MTTADDLIRWKGAVVPWVAQWSGELSPDKFTIGGNDLASMVRYSNEQPSDRFMGVLWWRQGITRGGEPQFSQLNTYRQRAALLRRLCQVCGRRLPEGSITHWLMGRGQLDVVDGETLTNNPPTCPDCVSVATRLCPHLMSGGAQLLEEIAEYFVALDEWLTGGGFLPEAWTTPRTVHVLATYSESAGLVATVHRGEPEARDTLRANFAEGDDVSDEALVEHVGGQGVVVDLTEQQV